MAKKSTHPTDLDHLRRQAVALAEKFATAARRAGRKPWTREEIAQGLVVDVGDLIRLVMAKAGRRNVVNTDRKFGHELADCLWSMLVLADLYGVDLEVEFEKMVSGVGRKLERKKRSKSSL